MAVADELMEVAQHLAQTPPGIAEQACLRRAVSTAYYGLFHLLVQDAAARWQGSEASRRQVERFFEHQHIRAAANAVLDRGNRELKQKRPITTPFELRFVAEQVIELLQNRQSADYDNSAEWTQSRAQALVDGASEAVQKWRAIAGTADAEAFLLSFFVKRRD